MSVVLVNKSSFVLNAVPANLSFVTDNVVFYKFENGGGRITKITSTGFEEGVYLNRFIADLPTFSVKIMKDTDSGIQVGVAVDSSHFTLPVHVNSWCYSSGGYIYDHNAFTNTGIETPTNSIVTVTVDLQNKTISYKIDGNPVGTPQQMNLVDSEFVRLRPIVQMYHVGDSVEIYP